MMPLLSTYLTKNRNQLTSKYIKGDVFDTILMLAVIEYLKNPINILD